MFFFLFLFLFFVPCLSRLYLFIYIFYSIILKDVPIMFVYKIINGNLTASYCERAFLFQVPHFSYCYCSSQEKMWQTRSSFFFSFSSSHMYIYIYCLYCKMKTNQSKINKTIYFILF